MFNILLLVIAGYVLAKEMTLIPDRMLTTIVKDTLYFYDVSNFGYESPKLIHFERSNCNVDIYISVTETFDDVETFSHDNSTYDFKNNDSQRLYVKSNNSCEGGIIVQVDGDPIYMPFNGTNIKITGFSTYYTKINAVEGTTRIDIFSRSSVKNYPIIITVGKSRSLTQPLLSEYELGPNSEFTYELPFYEDDFCLCDIWVSYRHKFTGFLDVNTSTIFIFNSLTDQRITPDNLDILSYSVFCLTVNFLVCLLSMIMIYYLTICLAKRAERKKALLEKSNEPIVVEMNQPLINGSEI